MGLLENIISLMDGKEWGKIGDLKHNFVNAECVLQDIELYYYGKYEFNKNAFKDYYFNGQELVLHYRYGSISCCVRMWKNKRYITAVYGKDGLIHEYKIDYDK